VFLLLLCETAKKARPAGQNKLAVHAEKTLGGHAEREKVKGRDADSSLVKRQTNQATPSPSQARGLLD